MSRAAKRRRRESNKSAEKIKNEEDHFQIDLNRSGESVADCLDLDTASLSNSAISDLNIISALDKVDVIDILAEDRAQLLMGIFLAPITRGDFYRDFWQNQPLYIENAKKASTLNDVCSASDVDDIINRHVLRHSEDIILGKYYDAYQSYFVRDKTRADDTPEDVEISGSEVWRALANGYSIQLNSLQKYNDNIWRLLAGLEHEFGAPLKSHFTVTSGHFAGFGPMLADGDEFIFQMEGSEKYRIHGSHLGSTAASSSAQWPPSVDACKTLVEPGRLTAPPMLETEMSAGDMIYVPRGWVVEVLRPSAMADVRSAHLTVSTNHKNNLLALAEAIFPQTLLLLEQRGSGVPQPRPVSSSSGNTSSRSSRVDGASSLAFRALPRQVLSYMGVARSEDDDEPRRLQLRSNFKRVLEVMQETALDLLDAAVDQVCLFLCCGVDNLM